MIVVPRCGRSRSWVHGRSWLGSWAWPGSLSRLRLRRWSGLRRLKRWAYTWFAPFEPSPTLTPTGGDRLWLARTSFRFPKRKACVLSLHVVAVRFSSARTSRFKRVRLAFSSPPPSIPSLGAAHSLASTLVYTCSASDPPKTPETGPPGAPLT